MTRWHAGVGRVRVRIACRGEQHHVLFRRGALVLEDHDAEGELALAALGGPSEPCVEVLRLWRDGVIGEAEAGQPHWTTFRAGPAAPSLPEPLRRLRELTMVHTWARGLRTLARADRAAAAERFLVGSLRRRARAALETDVRAIARAMGSVAGPIIEIECLAAGESPWARGRVEPSRAALAVGLPATWLRDVWARQITMIGPAAVLDARRAPADADDATVTLLRWMPDGPRQWLATTERVSVVSGPSGWREIVPVP